MWGKGKNHHTHEHDHVHIHVHVNSLDELNNYDQKKQKQTSTVQQMYPSLRAEMGMASILPAVQNAFMKQQGERVSKQAIKFNNSFMGSPQVIVGLSALDGSKNANTRIAASAIDITNQGFTMVIKTWSDTVIWAANVNWTAIGV